jgi:AcrR family transcriptional regulator
MKMDKKLPRRLGRPPKQEASNTRERILDVALELFATQGFAGTSIRQITQAVGIRESAIYAHFVSKQEMYETLFEEVGPPAFLLLELLEAGEYERLRNEPERFLREVVRLISESWDEPRARRFASVLMREGIMGMIPGKATVLGAVEMGQQRLGGLLRAWMERGLIKSPISEEHLAWEMLAPLVTIRLLYWNVQSSADDREIGHSMAERHVEYFLQSISCYQEKQEL